MSLCLPYSISPMTERTVTPPRLAWLTSLATHFTNVAPGRWLALMLLALHAAVVFDADAAVTRAFLLAHYGLFLLWQPLVRSEARIEPRLALPVFAMAALLVLVDSTWVIALWLAILAGLVGSVATSQNERCHKWTYLLALAYLLALLMAWVLPQSLGDTSLTDVLQAGVRYGLPLLPLVILFLPVTRQRSSASSTLDFIYGLMLSLLIMVMALGVFAVVAVAKVNYAWALVQTLLGMAACCWCCPGCGIRVPGFPDWGRSPRVICCRWACRSRAGHSAWRRWPSASAIRNPSCAMRCPICTN